MENFNKGDWVSYSTPVIKAILQIYEENSPLITASHRREAEMLLQGIVVGEEGDQVLVLHAGKSSPVLRDRRDLKKIEDNNEN